MIFNSLPKEIRECCKINEAGLAENSYPGRGIVIGLTPSGKKIVQVYWIMGRSENSRNRVFIAESEAAVRTRAFNEEKLVDPSLVIYYAARRARNAHIVTNGDQTDTVQKFLYNGASFEEALATRDFEPDGPNFTPRISGLADLDDPTYLYKLSILKHGASGSCDRHFFNYSKGLRGAGHCIHTYNEDGSPLPSFSGEPYLVSLEETVEANAKKFWELLDKENRVSIFAKLIDRKTQHGEIYVINGNY